MLHFLRQVRKNLVLQDNTKRYLLYAIGEILLVVIGILIALQVNNWNEDRALKNEIEIYLIKKIDNLQEDQKELQILYDYRVKAKESCTRILDYGLLNAPEDELVSLIRMITVERRFISAIESKQTSETNNYYKNIKEAKISDLEIEYLNLTDLVTFDEFRLNNFSEDLESDLWRKGFFNENRLFFLNDNEETENLPELILSEANGMTSLMAILRRNEISNLRLAIQYSELIELNEQLISTIQGYLNNQ